MRRIFGRIQPAAPAPLAGHVDADAHGCPACPHPANALYDFEKDGASTLLPVHQTDIAGHSLEQMVMPTGTFAVLDDDVTDFDLD